MKITRKSSLNVFLKDIFHHVRPLYLLKERRCKLKLDSIYGWGRGITQLTFYALVTSQDQAGPLLQVLPHFLTSKSLFWSNLPLTILSEYPLDSRLFLCILLFLLPSNCCFFFDFLLFCYFFLFQSLPSLFFNYLIPPSTCPCFFFGFHWCYTFWIFLLFFSLIHALSSILLFFVCFFVFVFVFFLISFWTYFLWFSCSFLLTNAFFYFLFLVAFTFFLGNLWLHLCSVIAISLHNVIWS